MASREYTAEEMRDTACRLLGEIGFNDPLVEYTVCKAEEMLRYAAGVVERCEEANRLVNAMINNHVTVTIDGIEYYQPFTKKDVMELKNVLRGDAGKDER